MPFYDRACAVCGVQRIDVLESIATTNPVCVCGGELERVHLPTGRGQVIGDECEVVVKHGLCHADGSPRRFTSKSEMRKEAEKRGLVNHVTHVGSKGSDRSRHTTRWI